MIEFSRRCLHVAAAVGAAFFMLVTPGSANDLVTTGAIAPGESTASSVGKAGLVFGRGALDGVSDGSSVRAVVRSVQNVIISSEINARITSMKLREGDVFKKGDTLVEFDCARTLAELEAAQATHKSRKLAHDNALALLSYNAAGTFAVDQARFESDKAAAEVKILEAKKETCTIIAPFDGRIVERQAQTYEVAQANQPLLKIAEGQNTELALMIPSHWLGTINKGSPFTIRIDETGKVYPATVKQIGGAIDPVSKSVRLIGVLSAEVVSIEPGMSGTAVFGISETAR